MIDLRRAVAIAAVLFVVYNLNLRAIGSRDTHVTEYLAFSLAAYGRADLDAFPDLGETGLVKGSLTLHDGHLRSNYPIVPAVLAAPVYWIAIVTGLIPADRPSQVRVEAAGKIAASGTAAAACAVLFLAVRRRLPVAPAAAIAIAAGLVTPLWSSASQALWSHAAGAFFLALGFLLDDGRVSDGPASRSARTWPAGAGRVAAAGAMFTLAAACRPLVGCFALGAAVSIALGPERGRRLLPFIAGSVVVAGALALHNLSGFGTLAGGTVRLESSEIHQIAHAVSSPWNPTLLGLAGILVSPSRGLLIFMPVVLAGAVDAARLWRARPDVRWRLLLPTAAFVIAWSSYAVWWAGHSYGPRYAADLAVPLALIAAAAVETSAVRPKSRAARAVLAAALVWSLSVQAIGAFRYPRGNWNSRPADVDLAHDRLWDWRDSQIPRTLLGHRQ